MIVLICKKMKSQEKLFTSGKGYWFVPTVPSAVCGFFFTLTFTQNSHGNTFLVFNEAIHGA